MAFTKKYRVSGMSCAACSARVEKAVSRLRGVERCEVNLLTATMTVDGEVSESEITEAVKKAGYGAVPIGDSKKRADAPEKNSGGVGDNETQALVKRFLVSLAILLPLMYVSMGHMMWGFPLPSALSENHLAIGLTELILTVVIMVINQKFFVSGIKGLLHGAPNMDTLVAIGAGASFIYSTWALYKMTSAAALGDSALMMSCMDEFYFESAAMILTLITLGKTLESYSKGKTTNAIRSLMELAPDTARVVRDGKEVVIPASELVKGDVFTVRAGEKIPADGIVTDGAAAVDESALTGESIPADKKVGDRVSAATVSKSGYITCAATDVGDDTALSKIIQMVSDAAGSKAPIAKTADRVSAVFVPAVMAAAALTFVVWLFIGGDLGYSLARGISVLVISCPCALGLATPVAIMVASGVGARMGILYKTAVSLEEAGKVKTAVFDKTGTLTKGEPTVTDIIPLGKYDSEKLLSLAASLEKKSEHPLGSAVIKKAEESGVSLYESRNFENIPGKGLHAEIDGDVFYGGNLGYIESVVGRADSSAREVTERLADEGKTPLIFGNSDGVCGVIAVADAVKEDSADAVGELSAMGVNVVMLTGDNERTARAVGEKIGIKEIIAGVLPDEKEGAVRRLKEGGKVAMVGDGINDAPALTSADVGIAIGAGTDVAIDAADVVLMKSSARDVAEAIKLSRRTLKNIRENLFWAFFYNTVGIPIAAGVLAPLGISLDPMFAAAAMSLSSFCVVTNALRLNLFGIKKSKSKNKTGKSNNLTKSTKSKGGTAKMSEKITKTNAEENEMIKVMRIDGMMCAHCEGRVKNALEGLDGVKEAVVNHENGTAVVTLEKKIGDNVLRDAVTSEGYTVL